MNLFVTVFAIIFKFIIKINYNPARSLDKRMQSQLQQMKSSIANIQHHLRKLQCQESTHLNRHADEQNILPESIIREHEHIYEKPMPTPKITSSQPNIIRTQVFVPSRHHLDDRQMKKILQQDAYRGFNCSTATSPRKYDQGKKELHKYTIRPEQMSENTNRGRKKKEKQKSATAKTKYIYDGARVVYVPPNIQSASDYGHLIVDTQKPKKKRNYSQFSEYSQSGKQISAKNLDNQVDIQYGMGKKRINKTKKYKRLGQQNKKQRLQSRDHEQKQGKSSKIKTKMSQFTVIPQISSYAQPIIIPNTQLIISTNVDHQYQNTNLSNFDRRTQRRKQAKQRPVSGPKRKMKKNEMKSMKIQCNLRKNKIKPPFIIDWNPHTDSEFSDMEI